MTKRYLLIIDSRGRNIEPLLDHFIILLGADAKFSVLMKVGARIHELVYVALHLLQSHSFDMIFFMGGVNNLSCKHSRCITPTYTDVPNLVDHMFDNFTWAYYKLKPHCKKVVLCHLIGLNFAMYNQFKWSQCCQYPDEQSVVNEGVILVNQAITMMNQDNGVVAPWTQDTVHNLVNGRRVHRYNKLYDGLHPSNELMTQWAKLIVKSAITNFAM